MVQGDQRHIADLDVLRGLAIVLVVAFHAQEFLVPGFALYASPGKELIWTPGAVGWERFLWNLSPAAMGWSGVDLFLLLSGFLIHWSTLRRSGSFSWMDFYRRRFWRIYPTYLLVLLVFIGLLGPFSQWDVISHVLLVHNYDPDTFYSINGSFWSLALEVQMYLLYPVLLLLNGQRGFIRSFVVVGSLSVLGMFIDRVYGPLGPVFNSSLVRLWVIWVVGAWMAERHHQGLPVFKQHVVLGLGLLVILPVLNLSVLRPFFLRYAFLLLFAVILDHVLVAGIRPVRKGRVNAVLKWILVAIAFLGTCSYSMYLIHQPVLRWYIRSIEEAGLEDVKWLGMVPLLLAITGLSYALFRLVEVPSMRLGLWTKRV
jgi:peptidoglycan/LPS O-acetylase OafA/YrhL